MYVCICMYICEHMYSIYACVCCVKWMGEWMDRYMHTYSVIHLFRMKLTNQVNISFYLLIYFYLSTLNQYPKLYVCACRQGQDDIVFITRKKKLHIVNPKTNYNVMFLAVFVK